MQNTEFKVGDTVWCAARGKGVVEFLLEDTQYPIGVKFDNGKKDFYTTEGKLYIDGSRCLFFSEPKVDALTTRPFTPTLKGKTCVLIPKSAAFDIEVVDIREETEDKIWVDANRFFYKRVIHQLYEVGAKVLDNSKAKN